MNRIITSCLLASLTLLVATPAFAIVTDRPDVAESSRTVPKMRFQVETGLDASFTDGNTGVSLPTKLRFGILDNVEMHLEGGVFSANFNDAGTQTARQDFALGGKIHLLDNTESRTSVGVLTALSLPISEGASTYVLRTTLAVDQGLTDTLGVGVNLFYIAQLNDRQTGNQDALGYATSLGFAALPQHNISFFLEAFGAIPLDQGDPNLFTDGGMIYSVSDTLQFDLYGRAGIVNADEFGVGGGVGILF